MNTSFFGGASNVIITDDGKISSAVSGISGLKNGLVAFHNFPSLNIGKSFDDSKDLTFSSQTGYSLEKVSKSFNLVNFDSSYLKYDNYLLSNGYSTDMSVSLFFRINSGNTIVSYKTIFGMFADYLGGSEFRCSLNYNSDGTISFMRNGRTITVYLPNPSSINHFCCTISNTAAFVYFNGNLVYSTTYNPGLGQSYQGTGSYTRFASDLTWGQTKCSIGLFGLWNRILTQEEAKVLYNNGKGLEYPFL